MSNLFPLPSSCTILPFHDNKSNKMVRECIKSLSSAKPRPSHNLVRLLQSRQLGKSLQTASLFCSSIPVVSRFNLLKRLEHGGHIKGVNSVQFGVLSGRVVLVSASDDLTVCVWDLEARKCITRQKTDHEILVTHAKLLDDQVVTSCYDGQVRLSVLGRADCSRLLVQHRGSVHRLTSEEHSNVIMSGGEDGQVFALDLRISKPIKLLFLENKRGLKVPVYSLQSNPNNSLKFCLSGRDQYLRLYDLRNLPTPEVTHCPPDLLTGGEMETGPNCAVFSRSGREVIISYDFLRHTDKNIYLFPSGGPDLIQPHRVFKGYRDSPALTFYGDKDEYIVSGSNDAYAGLNSGDIIFWDKDSGGVVRVVPGDRHGIVRGVESHPIPSVPLLASCGVDRQVKLWGPLPDTDDLYPIV